MDAEGELFPAARGSASRAARKSLMRLIGIAAAAVGLAGASTCLGAPRAAGRLPARATAGPTIAITAATPASRKVETRLARFIIALQRDRRADAARMLARDTPEEQRRAFLRGEWLNRARANDLSRLFYLPALRLRTLAIGDREARVRLLPLSRPGEGVAGFLDVAMVREASRWQIRIGPLGDIRAAARRRKASLLRAPGQRCDV
jgi:hypothetical protein